MATCIAQMRLRSVGVALGFTVAPALDFEDRRRTMRFAVASAWPSLKRATDIAAVVDDGLPQILGVARTLRVAATYRVAINRLPVASAYSQYLRAITTIWTVTMWPLFP